LPLRRTVDLSKNAFSLRISPALLQLRGLRTLVLSHNTLAGGIPRSVTAPIVHLDHQSNRLSGSVPATLVYLSLAGNRLSGRVVACIARKPVRSCAQLARGGVS
jgi:hypothetical protein